MYVAYAKKHIASWYPGYLPAPALFRNYSSKRSGELKAAPAAGIVILINALPEQVPVLFS